MAKSNETVPVTPRNPVSAERVLQTQWSTPGGWYLKSTRQLPGQVPMATYFQGQTAVAYQYLLVTRTPGVKVLR